MFKKIILHRKYYTENSINKDNRKNQQIVKLNNMSRQNELCPLKFFYNQNSASSIFHFTIHPNKRADEMFIPHPTRN